MNFQYTQYLPAILLAFGALAFSAFILERRFFKMVKTYWFYNRSLFSYLSTFFFLAGMGTLLFSLVDVRGPEEKIKTPVPTERTIILMDTSASMLAEDVKPSRLQKAALVAKHFARKAVGHQISIVAFSEIQKKIVPFTTDLDLIDARLDSIKSLRNQNGSSALSLAIQESIQYFKETGEARGNILVLTDGEETSESINLKIPKEVHVALVGIGTEQGGRIPLDDSRGFRFGYKKDKGKDVITHLNENFFKAAVADMPSGKYWLANTYSLPSEEILDFFKGEQMKAENEQDMVIKPVLMEWVVVPALVLLILSYVFKALRVFSLGLLLIAVLPVHAQEPQLNQEVIGKLEKLQKGDLNQLEKIKLADDLQKAGSKDEALALYEENLPMDHMPAEIPPEAYLNYGTALLEKGQEQKGLSVYESLASSLDPNSPKAKKLKEMIEKNVVSYFKVQEEKKEQKKNQKNQDQQKDNQDQQNNQDQNQQGNQNQDKQSKDQQQNGQQKPQNSKDQSGQDKKDQNKGDQGKEEKKDQKSESEKNDDQKDKNGEQGQPEQKKPLPPPKLDAKLKQLMSDDRNLQMQMIQQGTRDLNKRKSRQNKDW